MASVAAGNARTGAPRAPLAVVAGVLAVVTAGTLLLRTGILDSGYWIDEAIAVGIASHDLVDIPGALRRDGSPPLFYVLLHGWMELAGTGESATRVLSLLFAMLAVPVSWWAGNAVFDRRAGALAAAGAAGCPFLTYYAQETRMYSLVVVLSVLAGASFVLAFLHGRRRHLVLLGVWLTLLLYTHNWALFLVAGMGVAWLWLWRAGRVDGRDGVLVAAAIAVLYAPWVPSVCSSPPTPRLRGRRGRYRCGCSAYPARSSATSPRRCWRSPWSARSGAGERATRCGRWR